MLPPLIRTVRSSIATAMAVALLPVVVPAQARAERPSTEQTVAAPPTLRVLVALVLADMTVRPVPLHALELVEDADTTRRIVFRTGLNGTVSQAAAPGRYRLRSVQPATLNDSTYRWDLTVDVSAGGTTLELTNANARAAATSAPRIARQVAPEREVFERVKRGVFRVEAGLGHGTGFLLDTLGGLVVTNAHVVGSQTVVAVQLDTLARVPAQVVVRDHDADLALLRLPPGACADCPRLRLALPQAGEPLVVTGERLLAIGFPLSQEITLTSGIASSIRDGAIISDVNINPGNSGGPMLNLAGEVVAVNTFAEGDGRAGPGVSGSVATHRLGGLLAQAPAVLASLAPLENRALPSMPRDRYPMAVLKAFADTASIKAYQHFADRNAGRFTVSLSTPTQQLVLFTRADEAVSRDRRMREERAGISDDERYSEVKEIRDWLEYVGDATAPVVALTVNPKVGETGGSVFGRALAAGLAGVALQAQYKFQGDVRGVRVYRNGVEVQPLRGGHAPQKVLIENAWVALKDVADMGYYVFPPAAFAPDSAGSPPRVTVVIQDLKNPNSLSYVDFYDFTSARIWNDFGPYYLATGRVAEWRPANDTGKSPKVAYHCAPGAETCTFGTPEPRR